MPVWESKYQRGNINLPRPKIKMGFCFALSWLDEWVRNACFSQPFLVVRDIAAERYFADELLFCFKS